MKFSDLYQFDCAPERMTKQEKFWRIVGLVGWLAIYVFSVLSVFLK